MVELLKTKFKITEILNLIKGFKAVYTSKVVDKMIIEYNNRRYIVTFEEIENPAEEMVDDIDTYLC